MISFLFARALIAAVLYGVLDARLADHEYLAGDFSIDDIANSCWALAHGWAGIEIDNLPHLQRLIDTLEARPDCKKGVEVPFAVDYSGRSQDALDRVASVQGIVTK